MDNDELTPQEFQALDDPDDNPEHADVDASACNVHKAAICTALTALAALAAGICIGYALGNRD